MLVVVVRVVVVRVVVVSGVVVSAELVMVEAELMEAESVVVVEAESMEPELLPVARKVVVVDFCPQLGHRKPGPVGKQEWCPDVNQSLQVKGHRESMSMWSCLAPAELHVAVVPPVLLSMPKPPPATNPASPKAYPSTSSAQELPPLASDSRSIP
jgi:hypothetical protein